MKYKILTLNDIEDLNYIAENLLHELRFRDYMYDDYSQYIDDYDAQQRFDLQELHMENVKQSNCPLEFRNNEKLMLLSFRDVLDMSYQEIIDQYLKNYLAKFRGMIRTGSYMLTPFIASNDISDEYLDNLFALRYKENLKLWVKEYDIKKY